MHQFSCLRKACTVGIPEKFLHGFVTLTRVELCCVSTLNYCCIVNHPPPCFPLLPQRLAFLEPKMRSQFWRAGAR